MARWPPRGVALAPASFGPLGDLLLIGNFVDGVINARPALLTLRTFLRDILSAVMEAFR